MEKILIAIPVLSNGHCLQECMEQIVNKPVNILLLDNGADQDAKDVIESYRERPNVEIWHSKENKYVVEPWNKFILHFMMNRDFDRLLILNSDLTMGLDWFDVCQRIFSEHPTYSLIPYTVNDKLLMWNHYPYEGILHQVKDGLGVPGIFVTLNKAQADVIYPLPDKLKVWYGDTYLYRILAAYDFPVVVCQDLLAFHHTSMSIKENSYILDIIEQDKIVWRDEIEPEMQRRIKEITQ